MSIFAEEWLDSFLSALIVVVIFSGQGTRHKNVVVQWEYLVLTNVPPALVLVLAGILIKAPLLTTNIDTLTSLITWPAAIQVCIHLIMCGLSWRIDMALFSICSVLLNKLDSKV